MKKRTSALELGLYGLLLLLVLVMIYSGCQILESTVFHGSAEESRSSKIITRDGVDYFPRQDMTTMLVMGIDQFGPVAGSEDYTNTGAADMNILLIFDEQEKNCSVIHLNRDTMLEMPVLGIGGRQAGTDYGQLALAHTYGSGLDDSCLNSCKAVSNFLYGLEINYYLSMNMDAIAILNDAVGGVTVEVKDDFSLIDPGIPMGAVTLQGQQAIDYVRTRKDVGDQKNTSRIQRHQDYLDGFVDAFRAKKEQDTAFILEAYEQISPYIVTNCSANAVSGMVERYGDFRIREVLSPEGENIRGEQYYEFYADEAALDAMILRLLYAPKR